MLELINQSSLTVNLYPSHCKNDTLKMICVMKASYSFNLNGNLKPSKLAAPIEEYDRYYDKPENSSLAAANEIMPYKQGSELLIYGTAQLPSANSSYTEVHVYLEQQSAKIWQKSLKIFGPRFWQRSILGMIPSKPAKLNPLPIRYEYAFGGVDLKSNIAYPQNPVGIGYTKSKIRIKGLPLAQIEIGPSLINTSRAQLTPAGFSPIAPNWEPRKSQLEYMRDNQQPIPPASYLVAPLDQRFRKPFQGGEILCIKGMFADIPTAQTLELKLPIFKQTVQLLKNCKKYPLSPNCDTLIVNTDENTLQLIYRLATSQNMNDTTTDYLIIREL